MGFMCEPVIDWLIIVLVINRAALTRTKRTFNKGMKCERKPSLTLSQPVNNVVPGTAIFEEERMRGVQQIR